MSLSHKPRKSILTVEQLEDRVNPAPVVIAGVSFNLVGDKLVIAGNSQANQVTIEYGGVTDSVTVNAFNNDYGGHGLSAKEKSEGHTFYGVHNINASLADGSDRLT